MTPTVSVCVPTFNRASELRNTLQAVLTQTVTDLEVIVGDDASTDETAAVVSEFKDARLRYIRHPSNVGIYTNWNALLAVATGRYVAIYHDHDQYLPTILEQSVRLLASDDRIAFVHTASVLVDAEDAVIDIDVRPFPPVMPGQEFRRLLAASWHSPVMAATALVRRSAYEVAGPYDDRAFGLGCDKDMWFKLAGTGAVGYVQEPQARIRNRIKTDRTAVFSWRNVEGAFKMRERQLTEVYENSFVRGALPWLRMALSRNVWLAALLARAAILGGEKDFEVGRALVRRYCGAAAGQLMCSILESASLKSLLRRFILPVHYARIRRRQTLRRRAAAATYVGRHGSRPPFYDNNGSERRTSDCSASA
jgi:glycosyltransferase involved in cell wall biosynthesis